MPNRQGKFPKQFAWPVMDGIPVPPPKVEDTDRPTLRGLDSEYDSRYKWKVSTPDHKIKNRKVGRDEQVANPNGLFDGPDMNARGWMSEYDQQCAELRQQQNSLLSNPVAGIPSNRSGLIPAYYAWPETSKCIQCSALVSIVTLTLLEQPELPSKKPEPGVELPHSEYRDNYPDKSTFIDPQV